MSLICGIDPGLTRCGYSIVKHRGNKIERLVSCGLITTDKDTSKSERLLVLYNELEALFSQHEPDLVCVEKIFHQRNTKTATAVTQSQGIVLLVAEKLNIKQVEFTPTEIKSKVAGWGQAGKEEVSHMVEKLCKIDTSNMLPDITDSIACAITGIFQMGKLSNV